MVSEEATAVSLPILGNLTYREIHAVEDGFYVGFRDLDVDAADDGYTEKGEQHYWRVAWLAGHWTARGVNHE